VLDWDRQLAQAQNYVLERTFAFCEEDPACRRLFQSPVQQDALHIGAIYDELRARLLKADEPLTVRNGQGQLEQRALSAYDFEFAAGSAVAAPRARKRLLESLAAAWTHQDFLPLHFLAGYDGTDPGATPGKPEPARPPLPMSQGIYYTFICNDYQLSPGKPEQRLQAFIDQAAPFEKLGMRIRAPLYQELPCAVWPSAGRSKLSARPMSGQGMPVLVINARADAAVPPLQGNQVARGLTRGALIDVDGGKHIMYGYGKPCIDEPVSDFLLTGVLPAHSPIVCPDTWVEPIEAHLQN